MLLLSRCALVVVGALFSAAATAQSVPTKPIRVIVPFVAGGSSDIVRRAIGAKFQELLVVENQPGAGGFGVVAARPDEFGKFVRAELERWTRVVQKGGIKPD